MKAWIKTDKDDALWLCVDDGEGNETAHPILDGEVEAIRDACEEWLEIQSQNSMKTKKL